MWCLDEYSGNTWYPFGPLSDNASWTPIDHFDASMNPRYSAWWAPATGGSPVASVPTLPGTLFDNLWSPPTENDVSRAGWAKPLFFRDAVWQDVRDLTNWHPGTRDQFVCGYN
jgi:hypothetical protein